eukprot:CAMPEP_0117531146 /NCGR_PEP_ID=MMETSP0784-20121206/38710_1 /TAXON_ID=39447 /ORGANISM="" /LENGTH=321 /DNA_ID=CAMNT_0005327515 /DNA_START=78 /DNA_END=1040 /DNA_ORIENTATION=-
MAYGKVAKKEASKAGPKKDVTAAKKGAVESTTANKVYVQNLPWRVTWKDLKDHMAPAGAIEFSKIFTEDGSDHGRSKGIGCVRYATEDEAQHAVETLNGSELMGRAIDVSIWKGNGKVFGAGGVANADGFGMGGYRKGGFGKGGSGKGCFGKAGDGGVWVPIDLSDPMNPMMAMFLSAMGMGGDWAKGGAKGWATDWASSWAKGGANGSWKGGGKDVKVNPHGDPEAMVYVGGLPWKMQWQDLKDLMKQAGTVEFCKVLTEGAYSNRSKGVGCVRFASKREAAKAIQMFNGSQHEGRTLEVSVWGEKSRKDAEPSEHTSAT